MRTYEITVNSPTGHCKYPPVQGQNALDALETGIEEGMVYLPNGTSGDVFIACCETGLAIKLEAGLFVG